MMTIQKQNPELIEFSLKSKTIRISKLLIVLCAISAILCSCCSCSASDGYSPKIYDNTNSVEEVFNANEETFVEVAHLLKDSALFNYLYSIDRKSIFSPSIPRKEKYFNEKEIEYLSRFLNDYRPYEIGNRNGYLFFVFLCKNEDVTIYYTERENESLCEFLSVLNQNSASVKKIKEKWYFTVQLSDVVR